MKILKNIWEPSFNKLQLKNFLDPILNKKIFSNYLLGDFCELGFGELGGRRQNWCFYDCFILLTKMYQNSSQNLSIVQFAFLPLWRDKRKITHHYQQ